MSRYFSTDELGEDHSLVSYVNADSRLDPNADDLPIARKAELITIHVGITPGTGFTKVSNRIEERGLLSQGLSTNAEARDKPDPSLSFKDRALQMALKHFLNAYKSNKFFTEILKNNSCYKQFNI